MTDALCPACSRPQDEGLLCVACSSQIEMELGDVPAVVGDLDVTISRQDRIGAQGKAGNLASERWPYKPGPASVAVDLAGVLAAWAQELAGPRLWSTASAARALLSHMPEIRKHPQAAQILDEITDAMHQARHAVDRPADRAFVGPCNSNLEGVRCTEDLYARPNATHVRCGVCGTTHDVTERRAWLLEQAADRLYTVREAAQMIGSVGGITVTEASIRGYLHRGRIAYHTSTLIRLGDLLDVLLDDSQRRSA